MSDLRDRGFRVETCKIGEPLQSALEIAHKKYVLEKIGADLYYDPKELRWWETVTSFNDTIEWIKKNNAGHIAKTGWGFFRTARAT